MPPKRQNNTAAELPSTPTASRQRPMDDEDMSILHIMSQQMRSSPIPRSSRPNRTYKITRAQLHVMGTSAWIPTFKADGTEEGLEGTYLSSIEDVEAFDFLLYSQLQTALLHNGAYNDQWKRHFKTDHEPVPMNWVYTINQLEPSAALTHKTPRTAAMSKWLTLVGDKGIRLNTAAKLVVVYQVHRQIDNLLDFSEDVAQTVLKELDDRKRKRGLDEASPSS
mmetsp:Transcript_25346/g.68859  ORF Transcript_25346/g.68859 Transcript_25346/m.68859 type:complete len:222 (-) Transcript_25346:277-942(-)